jgi:formyltetrahydrofolate deformylase
MAFPSLILTLSCPDRKGISAGVTGLIASQCGNIVESAQYGDPQTQRFFMRVAFDLEEGQSCADFAQAFAHVAAQFQCDWNVVDKNKKMKTLIMVSRQGHCLNDLLYRIGTKRLPMDLVGVVSNHDVFRKRVEDEGFAYYHWPVSPQTKVAQEDRLLQLVSDHSVDLIILARYMQVLSPSVCEKMAGKIINIHHSFLPSFKGAKPYHRAYDRGVKLIGATAHFVTPDLDEGPIIEQDVGRIDHSLSVSQMIDYGHDIESRVLARAVRYVLDHRVLINGRKTVVFG